MDLPFPKNIHWKGQPFDFNRQYGFMMTVRIGTGEYEIRHAYRVYSPYEMGDFAVAKAALLQWFWRRLGAA